MKVNFKTVAENSDEFPALLKEISDPPSKIFIAGNLPQDPPAGNPKIAVVGTRKATSVGKSLAKELAKNLASSGIVVVSGLAIGIDTAAHHGALESGGKTIAVLANGLDKIYPAQNENLAEEIVKTGALISEYPEGTPSYPNQFLERNRIVSGLCLAVIVVEAPERSGSLATARFALEQNREVFVVPGPANHPNYKGSHQLIRDGARLISSAREVFEDLNLKIEPENKNGPAINSGFSGIKDGNQAKILTILSQSGRPLNIDKIIELSKLNPQTVNQSLAFLVLSGALKETEQGYTI